MASVRERGSKHSPQLAYSRYLDLRSDAEPSVQAEVEEAQHELGMAGG